MPFYQPPVSVVIAAYNEEKVIVRTVQSVLNNGYENFEVVVVDDGSKDRTLAVLAEEFAGDARVQILTQPNSGKEGALKHGIRHSSHNILVVLDPSTTVRK